METIKIMRKKKERKSYDEFCVRLLPYKNDNNASIWCFEW